MQGTYEYVNRSEYQPIKNEADRIIGKVQKELRSEGLTFQPHLIGSGNRGMVTRIRGGNRGFDLDYNIELQSIPGDWDAGDIHHAFRNALRRALKGTPYRDPEESTSSFTVKLVDPVTGRVVHSIDIAIAFYDGDTQHYLRYDKACGCFAFVPRGYRFDDRAYVWEIEERCEDGWGMIREEYLKVKNSNRDPCKRSLDLYTEAVRNVYDRMSKEWSVLSAASFIRDAFHP